MTRFCCSYIYPDDLEPMLTTCISICLYEIVLICLLLDSNRHAHALSEWACLCQAAVISTPADRISHAWYHYLVIGILSVVRVDAVPVNYLVGTDA